MEITNLMERKCQGLNGWKTLTAAKLPGSHLCCSCIVSVVNTREHDHRIPCQNKTSLCTSASASGENGCAASLLEGDQMLLQVNETIELVCVTAGFLYSQNHQQHSVGLCLIKHFLGDTKSRSDTLSSPSHWEMLHCSLHLSWAVTRTCPALCGADKGSVGFGLNTPSPAMPACMHLLMPQSVASVHF